MIESKINGKPNDKTLRKEWLKKKFASYEYHEDLLRLHERWLNHIHESFEHSNIQEKHPDQYNFFTKIAFPAFEKVKKPGQIAPNNWVPGQQAGYARYILDYSRDSGLEVEETWQWMKKKDQETLYDLWRNMVQICTNIRRTVDNTWGKNNDNILLDEQYTGPIDWPPNWRDEVDPRRPAPPPQYAGQPCPQTGWWSSPAKRDSRRHFTQGEVFPTIPSETARGLTLWLWDPDQDGAPGEDKS